LGATYRAMGDREKAAAELEQVLHIKQQTRSAEQTPPSAVRDLLFSVRPPADAREAGRP